MGVSVLSPDGKFVFSGCTQGDIYAHALLHSSNPNANAQTASGPTSFANTPYSSVPSTPHFNMLTTPHSVISSSIVSSSMISGSVLSGSDPATPMSASHRKRVNYKFFAEYKNVDGKVLGDRVKAHSAPVKFLAVVSRKDGT